MRQAQGTHKCSVLKLRMCVHLFAGKHQAGLAKSRRAMKQLRMPRIQAGGQTEKRTTVE